MFGDGSVPFLRALLDINILVPLCTRARNEVLPSNSY